LVGEITPEMQAVAVGITDAEIRVLLFVDAGTPAQVAEDFDAGAITQIVADYPEPDRDDPAVCFECVPVSPGQPIPVPEHYVLTFARAGLRFRQD